VYLVVLSPCLITVEPHVPVTGLVPYKTARYHNPEGIHSYGNMVASSNYCVLAFRNANGLGLPGKCEYGYGSCRSRNFSSSRVDRLRFPHSDCKVVTCRAYIVRGLKRTTHFHIVFEVNPSNVELNPICQLLALLGAHHILHVSRIRVKYWFNCTSTHHSPPWRRATESYWVSRGLEQCFSPFVRPRPSKFFFS